MNGLTLLVQIAVAIGLVVAYRAGIMRGARAARASSATPWRPVATVPAPITAAGNPAVAAAEATAGAAPAVGAARATSDGPPEPARGVANPARSADSPGTRTPSSGTMASPDTAAERARLIRSLESETAVLRRVLATTAGERDHLAGLAEDRRSLWHALADARTDAARYRALVIDLENNAPPPLLDGPNAPDDLKLIVGIGPVLERMLHHLGITTYRQIARWSERDIEEFDARLPEFPGRIRRDAWVTQARELHQSKFGESIPPRGR
jgi:predicted flap endonuclease-1-like 5' DNA nuclease